VVQRSVPNGARWHPDDHAGAIVLVSIGSIPIPDFGGLVNDLVESWEDVIGELNLRDRLHALQRGTHREANNALFAERRVEDAIITKFSRQVHGTSEDATEGDILAE
jgi:hypothetical protein